MGLEDITAFRKALAEKAKQKPRRPAVEAKTSTLTGGQTVTFDIYPGRH